MVYSGTSVTKNVKRNKSESLVQNVCFGGLLTAVLTAWVPKRTGEEVAMEIPSYVVSKTVRQFLKNELILCL